MKNAAYVKGSSIQMQVPNQQTQRTPLGFQRTIQVLIVLKTNQKLTLFLKNPFACNVIKKENVAQIQLPDYPLPSRFLHCENTFNEQCMTYIT